MKLTEIAIRRPAFMTMIFVAPRRAGDFRILAHGGGPAPQNGLAVGLDRDDLPRGRTQRSGIAGFQADRRSHQSG